MYADDSFMSLFLLMTNTITMLQLSTNFLTALCISSNGRQIVSYNLTRTKQSFCTLVALSHYSIASSTQYIQAAYRWGAVHSRVQVQLLGKTKGYIFIIFITTEDNVVT